MRIGRAGARALAAAQRKAQPLVMHYVTRAAEARRGVRIAAMTFPYPVFGTMLQGLECCWLGQLGQYTERAPCQALVGYMDRVRVTGFAWALAECLAVMGQPDLRMKEGRPRPARGRRRPHPRPQATVRAARCEPRIEVPGARRRRVHRADGVVAPPPRRSARPLLAGRARRGTHARHGGARAAGLRRAHDPRRGRGMARAARAPARRGRVRAGAAEHAAGGASPLSARRLPLARAACPVGRGRVPGRRHGPRQDGADPRAAARPRPGRAGAGGGADLRGRQLARRTARRAPGSRSTPRSLRSSRNLPARSQRHR